MTLAKADVNSMVFVAPTYNGYDLFYKNSVVAYEMGSNATIVVAVSNFGFEIDGRASSGESKGCALTIDELTRLQEDG